MLMGSKHGQTRMGVSSLSLGHALSGLNSLGAYTRTNPNPPGTVYYMPIPQALIAYTRAHVDPRLLSPDGNGLKYWKDYQNIPISYDPTDPISSASISPFATDIPGYPDWRNSMPAIGNQQSAQTYMTNRTDIGQNSLHLTSDVDYSIPIQFDPANGGQYKIGDYVIPLKTLLGTTVYNAADLNAANSARSGGLQFIAGELSNAIGRAAASIPGATEYSIRQAVIMAIDDNHPEKLQALLDAYNASPTAYQAALSRYVATALASVPTSSSSTLVYQPATAVQTAVMPTPTPYVPTISSPSYATATPTLPSAQDSYTSWGSNAGQMQTTPASNVVNAVSQLVPTPVNQMNSVNTLVPFSGASNTVNAIAPGTPSTSSSDLTTVAGITDWVKQNPLIAAGIAFGALFFFGGRR